MIKKELVEDCKTFCWYPFEENASILVLKGANGECIPFQGNDAMYISSENELDNEKFDYIVIHDNTLNHIQHLKSYLKDDGKILVTVANPLSVTYGLQVRKYFDGIATKGEIERTASEAGLVIEAFFYPYPNHWYPTEIFSDETINLITYGRLVDNYLPNYTEPEHMKENCEILQRERLMGRHANAFLAVLSKTTKIQDSNILYVKLSGDRKEKYQVLTEIVSVNGKKMVQKKPTNPVGEQHILDIHKNDTMSIGDKIRFLSSEKKEECVAYEFLELRTLDSLITQYAEAGDVASIQKELGRFWDNVLRQCERIDYKSEKFMSVFGSIGEDEIQLCLNPANIDLIAENIFLDGDGYVVIDNEWVFDFPVPVQFLIWRCIHELYQKHMQLTELIAEKELMSEYDITQELCDTYDVWNHKFTLDYVGAGRNVKYCETVGLPIITEDEFEAVGYLYYDYGDGFSEEAVSCITTRVGRCGMHVSSALTNVPKVQKIRFTPLKGHLCKCNIEFYVNGEKCLPIFKNSIHTESYNGIDQFVTSDPQLYYDVSDIEADELTITIVGTVHLMDRTEISRCIEEFQGDVRELQKEYGLVRKELDEIKSSRSWKIIDRCKKVRRKWSDYKDEITRND